MPLISLLPGSPHPLFQRDAAIGFLHVLHALRPSTAEILVAELIGVRQDTGHHVLLHRLPEGKGGQTFLQLSQPSVQVRFDRCWQEKAYLDGRLGQLEERLSSIAFRQAVEQDMVAGILADAYQFSDEDLRRRRSESVQNVKKTNGRISLEQRVRVALEEDDEWQD